MFNIGQYVRVTDNVGISHANRIRQVGIIRDQWGDLFNTGQQWYEVEFADGEVIHLQGKELESRTTFQLHVVNYDSELRNPLTGIRYSDSDTIYTVTPRGKIHSSTFRM